MQTPECNSIHSSHTCTQMSIVNNPLRKTLRVLQEGICIPKSLHKCGIFGQPGVCNGQISRQAFLDFRANSHSSPSKSWTDDGWIDKTSSQTVFIFHHKIRGFTVRMVTIYSSDTGIARIHYSFLFHLNIYCAGLS